jgi:hypothetical protein
MFTGLNRIGADVKAGFVNRRFLSGFITVHFVTDFCY